MVPKHKPGEFRLIHHLSYPKGDSANDFIDPKLCSVSYTRFDAAVHMVQRLGKGALLGKSDLKHAFRLIPVAKADFPLLGFKFDGYFFFFLIGHFLLAVVFHVPCLRVLPHFYSLLVTNLTVGELEHYLDDFIFGGKANTNHCAVIMANFQSCCQRLGVPISEEKTEGPATVIVFLGLELDSELMEVPIQIEKVQKLLSQIHKTLEQKSIKLQDLQSLIGSLNFMCRAIPPGRASLCRLINATCGVTKPFYHVHIISGMQHDLHTWLDFFQTFNGVSCFNDHFWCSNADVSLYTDSAAGYGNGFGAYFQGSWVRDGGQMNGLLLALPRTSQSWSYSLFLFVFTYGATS